MKTLAEKNQSKINLINYIDNKINNLVDIIGTVDQNKDCYIIVA
jgi:hypothetical protein